MDKLINYMIYLLYFVLLFDASNKLLKVKTEIFAVIFLLFIVKCFKNKTIKFNQEITTIVLLFITIPAISIFVSLIRNNFTTDAFIYYKSYLVIILVIILNSNKINYLPNIVKLLNLLSISIIFMFVLISILNVYNIDLYNKIYVFGNNTNIYWISPRKYGGFEYLAMYFQASPLLVISISFYLIRFCENTENKGDNIILALLNILAMFISGTRNNIIISIVLPLFILLFFYKNIHKKFLIGLFSLIIIIIFFIKMDIMSIILNMFDTKNDISNYTKISYINDYFASYNNKNSFLIGEGFGSEFYISISNKMTTETELTYLELIRRCGIIGAIFTMFILIYPVFRKKSKLTSNLLSLRIAFLFFLVMSSFNPLLFSSTGISIYVLLLNENYKS